MLFCCYCYCNFFILTASSQHYSIYIKDNRNSTKLNYDYRLTKDSILVQGVSDLGEKRVDFVKRALKKKEKKRLNKFIATYPLDTIREYYFADYVNYENISAENFPRLFETELMINGKEVKTKITNCYVNVYATLFEHINRLIPEPVRITYDKSKFKEFY